MEQFFEFHENSNSEVVLKSIRSGICSFPSILRLIIAYGNIKVQKSGKVLKLWHVNANSVDVMRLNILSWGLLDPIGTSRVKIGKAETTKLEVLH